MDGGAGLAGLVSGLGGAGDVARLSSQPGAKRASDQRLFSEVIAKAQAKADGTPRERARSAAEQLVATALVQPVLKSMRENSNAAPPFAPNETERTFRSFMDAAIAQRMVHSGNWALVDKVAQKMLSRTGAGSVGTSLNARLSTRA